LLELFRKGHFLWALFLDFNMYAHKLHMYVTWNIWICYSADLQNPQKMKPNSRKGFCGVYIYPGK